MAPFNAYRLLCGNDIMADEPSLNSLKSANRLLQQGAHPQPAFPHMPPGRGRYAPATIGREINTQPFGLAEARRKTARSVSAVVMPRPSSAAGRPAWRGTHVVAGAKIPH